METKDRQKGGCNVVAYALYCILYIEAAEGRAQLWQNPVP